MNTDLADALQQATALSSTDPSKALEAFRNILLDDSNVDADAVKLKEQAVQPLCDLYVKQDDAAGLSKLLSELRGFFTTIPKAKTAKIVRGIIDSISKIPNSTQLQVSLQHLTRREKHH
jgi:26S proteasome regulatory subunit N6